MAFARGKRSKAISDRSGQAFPYTEMVKEWNGSLVHISEFEAKHPQLEPRKHTVDPEALFNPRPDQAEDGGTGFVVITAPSITTNFSMLPNTIPSKFELAKLSSNLGSITVIENDDTTSVDVSGVSASSSLGAPTITGNITQDVSVLGYAATSALGTPTVTSTFTNFTITVASGTNFYGTGNKFYVDGVVSPTLTLNEGQTFRFDQSDSSNSGHPLRFSTDSNNSTAYTTGVTVVSSTQVKIVVATGAPTLYYYCNVHAGMGGQANTPVPQPNNLKVTTTNKGVDSISQSQYAAFDDVLFSASGFTFSINSSGNLIATI